MSIGIGLHNESGGVHLDGCPARLGYLLSPPESPRWETTFGTPLMGASLPSDPHADPYIIDFIRTTKALRGVA